MYMVEFIFLFVTMLFISAIFINGLYIVTREGMILGIWSRFLKGINPNAAKPLGNCVTCMSSIFGTICWLFWYRIAMLLNSIYPTGSVHLLISLSLFAKIGLWVFFCISLAWANEIVYNINNQFKKKP